MLKGIPAIISPEFMRIMMEMGHGDEIVLADGNFPASSCAARLVRCDGHGVPQILDALMKFFPLDYAVEHPAILMDIPPYFSPRPTVWDEYHTILNKYEVVKDFEFLNRHNFYERAQKAYAIVATGETARFANIILKKGVIA